MCKSTSAAAGGDNEGLCGLLRPSSKAKGKCGAN